MPGSLVPRASTFSLLISPITIVTEVCLPPRRRRYRARLLIITGTGWLVLVLSLVVEAISSGVMVATFQEG